MPDYDSDFYGWANEQAALLRAGLLRNADVANIAEEIESMGCGEKRELVNRLGVLLHHLLKWQVQPNLRGTSWRLAIEEQRDRLNDNLGDNPSLRPGLLDATVVGYRHAVRAAQRDTGLARSALPPVCPWTQAEIMSEEFYPQ